jgi:hypothetical protein
MFAQKRFATGAEICKPFTEKFHCICEITWFWQSSKHFSIKKITANITLLFLFGLLLYYFYLTAITLVLAKYVKCIDVAIGHYFKYISVLAEGKNVN